MVGLSDDSNEGLPEDAIKEAIRAGLINVNTCLPGKFISFDAVKQTAVIQISLLRNLNGELQPIAQLADVPVKFPRAGGFAITFPIAAGDRCEVRFSQRSIDNWSKSLSDTVDPADTRLFDLSDAIADLGLYPEVEPLSGYSTTDLVLRNEDGTISFTIKPDGSFEWVNPLLAAKFSSDGKYKFGGLGGVDELMQILIDFCTVMDNALVQAGVPIPFTAATKAQIQAIRARITAMRAP